MNFEAVLNTGEILMESNSGVIAGIIACCCCLPIIIIVVGLSLAVPIFLLTVGIVKLNDCPVDPRIPVWLICTASLIFLHSIFEACAAKMEKSCSLIYISRLLLLASTIVGCVFVFSSFSVKDGCDGLLYYSAFVYCIISLIGYSLVILLALCGCCALGVGLGIGALQRQESF